MKVYLILTQILYVIGLLPWFVFWGLSFMSFDSGVGAANLGFVLAITIYPIAVVACSIIAWVIHKRKKRAAVIVNLIPMLWVLGLGSLFLL
ncbi:hypothetical protein [Paenibacillus paeoniae]|uniref:Uncharacterized protein n=1 Tax=Paenibacillus paeoniae TaxID=2292705 RepID=A0A371PEE0_9BACL|nr:hypothetical protein [Paenibacillus paeoniae]REK74284.1 hypothetical protein DX130_17250 [Paenibacillus paeoniae]